MAAQDPQTIAGGIQPENAERSSSARAAFLLAITLLDVFLFLLLVSGLIKSFLQSDQFTMLTQVFTALVASGGVFAAGKKWFNDFLISLPSKSWFMPVALGFFVVLGLVNVARLPLITLHPVIDRHATLDVDEKRYEHYQGTVRVSLAPHMFRVGTPSDEEGKPQEYELGLKDVFLALFHNYNAVWSPLFAVNLKTKVPKLEVLIRKTDGDFDSGFRENPESTWQHLRFEPKAGANDVFIWQASDTEFGSADVVYLPRGTYQFTASKKACDKNGPNKVIDLSLDRVQDGGQDADFESLCD
jgi:hypothetical protein